MDSIPFTKPSFTWREHRAVQQVLKSGWTTLGPITAQFEQSLIDFIGSKHAVATCSCTSALWMMLKAIGITHGSKVILPTTTFAATANTVWQCHATPLFADIDPHKMVMDIESVKGIIEAHGPIDAIVNVYYAGTPYDVRPLKQLADEHGIRLVSDGAHAIGTRLCDGSHVGMVEDAMALSFNIQKTVTTCGGGAVITNDDSIAEFARTFRNQGRDGSGGSYDVVGEGFHSYMIDLHAAVGIEQMKRVKRLLDLRDTVARYYSYIIPSPMQQDRFVGTHSHHLYPVLVDNAREVQKRMKERGVACSFHYPSLHKTPFYSHVHDGRELAGADYFETHELTLPLWSGMTRMQAHKVVEILNEVQFL